MIALVDDDDYEFLNKWKWSASQESRKGLKWYAIRHSLKSERRPRIKIRMHHAVMGVTRESLDGLVVHHINDDGLDNQKHNLEILSQRENMLACKNWCRKKEEPFL